MRQPDAYEAWQDQGMAFRARRWQECSLFLRVLPTQAGYNQVHRDV